MLKTIIWREFLANIITFRFLFGLLICVGLIAVSTYVLMQEYEGRLSDYHLAVQAHTGEIRNIEVYSKLAVSHRPKADKKPRLLSVLNKGVEGYLGETVEVAHSLVPTAATTLESDNPYLAVLPRMDLSLVFQIVISLLAFLFAYDAVAGEREGGTLALTLSNPVARGVLLWGKYLGGMLSLVVPLALSLLVMLQVILFSPSGSLSAAESARIGVFCGVSLLYVSVFFTLGMLFSARARRAATALMFTMFFWVMFVLIWPSASVFIISKLAPLKSDADVNWDVAREKWIAGTDPSEHPLLDLWQNHFEREVGDFVKQHQVPLEFEGGIDTGSAEVLAWNLGYTGKFNAPVEKLPLIHEYFQFREELAIKYADQVGQMQYKYLTENPIRQAKLARNLARISPASAYADATAILADTDLGSHLRFIAQAKQYRAELIQYLRDQNAFASEAWYNPEAGKKINQEGVPLFREHPESLASSLRRAGIDLGILIVLNVAFFMLTFLSFLRYDVR